ncbi:TM2 domain-containing protein 1 isoform X1 [Bos indicus]|uniref:TM2 domain-containing protein 1 isoform X1 n=1 Tax=Bos indicus TaxID=9915 RepID=A0ABM4S434_BOSIN|nr:TM2 domain-containing protein 1 isoform X1 [Bos indicus x Bos taurus]
MAAACPCRPIAPDTAAARLLGALWFVSVTTGPWGAAAGGGEETLKCEDLKVGQYICKDPKINDATQEPVNCTNYTAYVQCFPAPNITCKDFGGNETHFTGNEVGFLKPISCRNVNGYSYKVAVALSLFLGWLGADRFYLGYPALGLLKFCTVGFCGIGSLIDFILISMQKLKSSKLQPKKKTGMSGSALENPGVGLVLDKTKSIQSNVLTTPLLFISASLC